MLSAILISRLVLRMRRMYVASIRLHFHEESRMSEMHRTQFDHVRLGLLSLVIWSLLFWLFLTRDLHKAQWWSKSVLTFDRCRPHFVTFGYY